MEILKWHDTVPSFPSGAVLGEGCYKISLIIHLFGMEMQAPIWGSFCTQENIFISAYF